MNTRTPDSGAGTPLENGATGVSHTVGPHYTQATASDAGEAVDPESGVALGPEEAAAVSREENEGGTMVVPPRSRLYPIPGSAAVLMGAIAQGMTHDPEGPTGA